MIGPTALLAACSLNAFGSYDLLSANITHPHPSLERVVYEVEVDNQQLNRFAITHVSDRHGGRSGPVLLLSPFVPLASRTNAVLAVPMERLL